MVDFINNAILALALGAMHTIEPDHLIAISLISSRAKNKMSSILAGFFWGIAHGSIICIAVVFLSLFNLQLSTESVHLAESMVGVLLIALGLNTLYNLQISRDIGTVMKKSKVDTASTRVIGMSFFTGLLHGLAGSGAALVLIFSLQTENSIYLGLSFLAGNALGMSLSAYFFGAVLIFLKKKAFGILLTSVRLGLALISLIFGTNLLLS